MTTARRESAAKAPLDVAVDTLRIIHRLATRASSKNASKIEKHDAYYSIMVEVECCLEAVGRRLAAPTSGDGGTGTVNEVD